MPLRHIVFCKLDMLKNKNVLTLAEIELDAREDQSKALHTSWTLTNASCMEHEETELTLANFK
jgi:hypothetical protein